MAAILVCSRAGENLIEGQLKKLGIGNTQILAEKLSEQLQCPLYTLDPVEPYPESYRAMVEHAKKEKAANDFPRYQIRGSRVNKADTAIQNWVSQHFITIEEGVDRYGKETNCRKR